MKQRGALFINCIRAVRLNDNAILPSWKLVSYMRWS